MQKVKLNNGIEMPILGYGVYLVSPEECERCVLDAISVGYRSIDTAQAYYNEEGVGAAITKCGVPRSELFITTKVWISNAGESRAAASIDESLQKLRTEYIDLLLIHQPFGDYYGTYRAMEKAVKAGKVRSIGWDAEIEMNKYDTHIMAWAPLTQANKTLFDNPTIAKIAENHNKTATQVALRYLIQRNIIAIPKSTHIERMKQNLDVFDFSLTDAEMEAIRPLDQEADFQWSHRNPELVRFLLNYDKQFNPKNK